MHALFPALIQAAAALNIDDEVVQAAKAALTSLPDLPLMLPGTNALLAKNERTNPNAVIANSYNLTAIVHNQENLGLEPVWPYSLIGDDGPLHALGVRTFMQRTNKAMADWSADPVQAARLGLGEEMKTALHVVTERYQFYPSGLAQLTDAPEFYVEQVGVVADALQNGLVQDYDGLVRIKAAWPDDWDADGTVVVQHGDKVHLQVRKGKIISLGVQAAQSGNLKMRNPWPGRAIKIVPNKQQPYIPTRDSKDTFTMKLQAEVSYRIIPEQENEDQLPFAPVTGSLSMTPKKQGSRSIGLLAR
nr:hypothetical protein [Edaphobacter modestus]